MRLRKMWTLLLAALAWLPPASGAERSDFSMLLKLYRDFGMPLPANGARLIQYSHPGTSIVNGIEQKPRQHLAYLAKEEAKSLTLLVGPIMKRTAKDEIAWKVIAPKAVKADKIEMESFGLSV